MLLLRLFKVPVFRQALPDPHAPPAPFGQCAPLALPGRGAPPVFAGVRALRAPLGLLAPAALPGCRAPLAYW